MQTAYCFEIKTLVKQEFSKPTWTSFTEAFCKNCSLFMLTFLLMALQRVRVYFIAGEVASFCLAAYT